MEIGDKNNITDVPGIFVGHARSKNYDTGVTVVHPHRTCVASVECRGGSPGTRETDALRPENLGGHPHAIVLSGGSAPGLSSADGVSRYLQSKGVSIPIIPAAIIYDMHNGENFSSVNYSELGEEAIKNLSQDTDQGRVGVGSGALSAKHIGGLGSVSICYENYIVGALTVVNSFGSTMLPNESAFWAWALEQNNEYGGMKPTFDNLSLDFKISKFPEYKNSTLSVVATNAKLTCSEAKRVAIMAHAGMGSSIRPCHGPTDGDVIFVLSTGKEELQRTKQTIARLGMMASDCVSRSIARAIYESNFK